MLLTRKHLEKELENLRTIVLRGAYGTESIESPAYLDELQHALSAAKRAVCRVKQEEHP
jgi:hypothetical protein